MASTVSEPLRITKNILDFCLTEESTELKSFSVQQLCDKIGQQCSVKAVYNIILELASDSLYMIEKKRYVSSATLLRSLFEYYFELLFLAKHPKNYKQRELDAKREQLAMVNSLKESKDPYLVKITTDRRIEPRKVELENNLKGHPRKSIQSRCVDLNYEWMYEMVYRTLSPVAHPSIVNYSNRYSKADSSGQMLEYHPDSDLDDEDAIRRLILLSNILINSTSCIHQILPDSNASAIETQLEKFFRELEKATPRSITKQ